jgi:hypothetical protein
MREHPNNSDPNTKSGSQVASKSDADGWNPAWARFGWALSEEDCFQQFVEANLGDQMNEWIC